ncbi:hypothetical protein [Streptomyces sp. NBC_00140]|uniref:hypothetical protein n=1 Tax=Streptomyces sp. NBC_00140 TaxID=2975664 RepID=UPI00225AEBCB|nr:hypothetical protein [Streptomyces sp. NBC_00140]MCX5333459.1 hypothetical protein [Streptomyces sp. NBC_00140]
MGGLAASAAAGAVFDGTQKDLVTGSRIAKKPKIKAFLSRPGTLWFLFLFNGGTAVAMMGLVSLGAGGGIVAGHRKQAEARALRV